MADPMKIRAQMRGDICDIKVLMSHPMETGQRKDGAGNTIPRHFIQTLSIAVNGRVLVDGQTGTSVSRNPVFGFRVRGVKAGERVTASWIDNKGDKRTDEATVA